MEATLRGADCADREACRLSQGPQRGRVASIGKAGVGSAGDGIEHVIPAPAACCGQEPGQPVTCCPRWGHVFLVSFAELEPGEPIPSQNTIIQAYGVARMTAHKPLGFLVDEGLVVVVPGVGALVARRKGLALS
jgi:hypothetical protein